MQFNGKYVNIDQILEKVRMDYGFEDVYKDECKEWVWDIMGIVGITSILEDRNAEITIEDHRGLLPTDLYKFDAESGIREKYSNYSLLPTTDIFFDENSSSTALAQALIAAKSTNLTYDQLGDDIVSQTDDSTINVDTVYTSGYVYERENYTYRIQGNYIFCGLENTTLQIVYKAFPIWDDLTPKIPDDDKYIRMVVTHLAYKIANRMYYTGFMTDRMFDRLEQEYMFTVASARSKMIIPDKDEMENIGRMRMRLLPKPAAFDTGFKYLSTREKLRKM